MRLKFTPRTLALYVAALMLLLVAGVGYANQRAQAGPSDGQDMYRMAAISGDGHVTHSVLLSQEARTMPNTTPVAGQTACIQGDASQFAAQLVLSGTPAGTAPTLAVVLQHSIDNGLSWNTVHSFTVINATVTPAAQLVSFSDVAASTAITFGDCFRVQYTWGGSGTVVANVGVQMISK